jgi:hypothetical protein
MKARAAMAIAAAIASGCMMVVQDAPEAGPVDSGGGGGGGGGGGNGDSPLDFGDSGDSGGTPVPGSGIDGDNGTAILALIRVDQGTANVATAVVTALQHLTASLADNGLRVTSIAVADLYEPQTILWGVRANEPSAAPLAGVLRAVSATRSGAQPANCTTAALLTDGISLPVWSMGGVPLFSPPPGALLVVLIETGARPRPLSNCVDSQLLWSADPVRWASLGVLTRRGQTRFLLLATPENQSGDAMRAHCLGVPGFPTTALDALAPSAASFFDPMAAQMNAVSTQLATRVDLCDAFGDGATALWDELGRGWYQQLGALR